MGASVRAFVCSACGAGSGGEERSAEGGGSGRSARAARLRFLPRCASAASLPPLSPSRVSSGQAGQPAGRPQEGWCWPARRLGSVCKRRTVGGGLLKFSLSVSAFCRSRACHKPHSGLLGWKKVFDSWVHAVGRRGCLGTGLGSARRLSESVEQVCVVCPC